MNHHPRVSLSVDRRDLTDIEVRVQPNEHLACGYLAAVSFGHLTIQTFADCTGEDLAAALEQAALELRHLAAEFRGEQVAA